MPRRFYPLLTITAWGLTAGPIYSEGSVPDTAKRDSSAESRGRYPEGQLAVYEGNAQIRQTTDGEVGPPTQFVTSEIVVATPPAGAGKTGHVLVVRSVEPAGKGSDEQVEAAGGFDIFTRGSEGLEPAEPPMELEEARHLLGVYVPLRLDIPTKSEKGVRRSVKILNQIPVEATVDIEVVERDGGTAQSLTLAGDSTPEFDFRGSKAKLREWTETCSIGKNGVVTSKSFSYAFDIDFRGSSITLSLNNTLKLRSLVANVAKGPEKLATALGAYREIVAGFRARKGSKALAPQVKSLGDQVKGTPYGAFAIAARTQLTGYAATFEADDAGRLLAKLLGGKAPNFVLDDLDGKKTDFHQASAGKVTYLIFWGVG